MRRRKVFSGEAWKIGLFIDIIKRHLDYFYEHFFSKILKGPELGHNINVYLEMKI